MFDSKAQASDENDMATILQEIDDKAQGFRV